MLIAFTGKKRSGKTTAKNAVVRFFKERGRECTVVSFGLPLKRAVAGIFGFDFDPGRGDEEIKNSSRPKTVSGEQVELLNLWLKSNNLPPLTTSERNLFKISGKEGEVWRWLLQIVGTDIVRERDREFWIRRAREEINRALSQGKNVVVDDLRFPAEAEMIRELGGIVIKLIRTDDREADNHRSERAVEEIEPDFEIRAPSGGVRIIEKRVKLILSMLTAEKRALTLLSLLF